MNQVRPPRPHRRLFHRPVGRDELHPPADLQSPVLRPAVPVPGALPGRDRARRRRDRPLDRTTLVIAPEGRLVEQYSSDPASRALAKAFGDDDAGEVQLRDLLRAIDAAKDDKHIERVLLRVDQLQPSGYASMREVAAALARLRASGKQIVAFGENWTRPSTCSPRRPTRSTSTRWAACCWKASAVIASTTAKACRTSSAWTCTCSASASSSPPPSPTSSTPRRRNPRKPTCSG